MFQPSSIMSAKLLLKFSIVIMVTIVALALVWPAKAGGNVATCDEATLTAALAGGGTVTFSCSGIIPITTAKTIAANTIIDAAGQTVVLTGTLDTKMFIINQDQSLTLRNLTLTHPSYNIALNAPIEMRNGGTITLDTVTVQDSIMLDFGVILAQLGTGASSTVNVSSSTINNNRSYGFGAGFISVLGAGTLNISDSAFTNNVGTIQYGGVIRLDGTTVANITGSQFLTNSTVNQFGGAIRSDSTGSLSINNSTFTNNSAPGGGAIYLLDGVLNLNQTNFIDNSAATFGSGGGGAIYNDGGSVNINTGTFDNNFTTAANGDGGAIFVQNGGSLNINDGTFTDNSTINAAATEGGAIILIQTSILTITTSIFERNYSPVGGAITLWSGSMTINNGTFNDNTTPGNGGAIYAGGPSSISNSTFTSNGANQGGGISFNSAAALSVTDSTFTDNTATHSGGGIFTQTPNGQISGSTFSGNSANLGGGIDTTTGANTTVTNSTLYNNTGTTKGGAFYNYDGGILTAINVTASDNTSAGGGGAHVESAAGAVLHLINTILANSSGDDCVSINSTLGTDTNNLIETHTGCGSPVSTADPALGALQNNGGSTETMAISDSSLAFNSGSNASCPTTDQRGISRPQNGTCDIGAYEYVIPG